MRISDWSSDVCSSDLKVEGWIAKCADEGAELVIDGRGFTLQGHEKGFFVGPTLIDHVTPDMESYKEEIFGPVLQIVRAPDFEAALELPSKHQYGNGVAIFTRNGHAARVLAARDRKSTRLNSRH